MAEIEKVIKQLELLSTHNVAPNIMKKAIQTIRELQNDNEELFKKLFLVDCESCKAHYEDAIRELQEQIPKWNLVADGDLPKDDTAVIAYIKREITDVFMMVNISSISGKWQMWESDRDLYDDEKVIAWCELPKFEEVE